MSDLIEHFEQFVIRLMSLPSGVGLGLQDRQLLENTLTHIRELETEIKTLGIQAEGDRARAYIDLYDLRECAEKAEERQSALEIVLRRLVPVNYFPITGCECPHCEAVRIIEMEPTDNA